MRICKSSGDLVLAEERDISDVLREGRQPHIKFQPSKPLTSLYSTFRTLQPLEPGYYLLHHNNKAEAFVSLLKFSDNTMIIEFTLRLVGHFC